MCSFIVFMQIIKIWLESKYFHLLSQEWLIQQTGLPPRWSCLRSNSTETIKTWAVGVKYNIPLSEAAFTPADLFFGCHCCTSSDVSTEPLILRGYQTWCSCFISQTCNYFEASILKTSCCWAHFIPRSHIPSSLHCIVYVPCQLRVQIIHSAHSRLHTNKQFNFTQQGLWIILGSRVTTSGKRRRFGHHKPSAV